MQAILPGASCGYSSIPTIAAQVIDTGSPATTLTVSAFTTQGTCPSLTYKVRTSPSPAPGGATVSLPTSTSPSIVVTQGANIHSFAVSIEHQVVGTNEVVGFTTFMVHPHNSAAATFATFCTTNPTSCSCTGGCATVANFCSNNLNLLDVNQADASYFIEPAATPFTYDLVPFALRSGQPDLGCA